MTAQDRAEPYFRLGLAKAAISRFDDAVLNLKLGLQLDNDLPQTGPQLVDLFGEHNLLPKTQFMHRLLTWVREDIRDPDRLFLLGVVLHMDNDAEQRRSCSRRRPVWGNEAASARIRPPRDATRRPYCLVRDKNRPKIHRRQRSMSYAAR